MVHLGIFILEAGRKLLRKYDIQVLKTSTGIFYSSNKYIAY